MYRKFACYTHRRNIEKGDLRIRQDVRLHVGTVSPAKQHGLPLREVGGAVVAYGLRFAPGGKESSRLGTYLRFRRGKRARRFVQLIEDRQKRKTKKIKYFEVRNILGGWKLCLAASWESAHGLGSGSAAVCRGA